MKVRLWSLVVLALAVFLVWESWRVAYGADKDVPRVERETLKGWLGDPNLVLIDVRAAKDWQESDKKIKGAVRQDPEKTKTWAAGLPKEKKIVLYCA
jgi:3-mercaptopyruvate sulfurtransferase SseA